MIIYESFTVRRVYTSLFPQEQLIMEFTDKGVNKI